MPRTLDELAARGVRFTNAFVTTPLCSPSRVSMLTGQHTHHHGVLNNDPPYGGVTRFNDASTLATWLQRRGYRTGMYGKYLADYRRLCRAAAQCYVPPGWDDWHVFLQQKYYGYQLVENGQVNSYGTGPADYSTDVLASKAVEFIMNAHGQPFFLHVGFHAPHGDAGGKAKPAPRHLNTLIDIAPWRPTSYDEDDTTDKPPWLPQIRASDLINPLLPYGVWTDEIRRSQLEALLAVDEAIESLMAALDATGQSDNTVVVFTSDNGYLWGEHRLFFGKDYPYEESLRVPLIIRDPRLVGAPRTETRLALNIDLAPTLAELAGVNPTTAVDGMSLVPLLRDPAAPWRSDFLFEWGRLSAPPRAGLPPYVGVRSERFKYCSYPTVGLAELYDLTIDPNELNDLSSDPSYARVRAELQSRLDEYLPAR